jgi:hypothetical protein
MSAPTQAEPVSAVQSLTPMIRDECLRDSRTALQHVCTQEVNFELAGRMALARDARASIWAVDYRGEG